MRVAGMISLGIAGSLVVWTMVSAALGDLRVFLPWPWEVFAHLVAILGTADCWDDIAQTGVRTLVAFIAGVVIGVPLGMLLGLHHSVYRATMVPIDFIRSIPVTALFPVAMLFLGVGDAAKLACVTLACGLITLVTAAGAVHHRPKIHGQVGRMLEMSRSRQFCQITLPAAFPEVVHGMRVAVSIALILVVVLEMFVGSERGLGMRLYDDQQLFRTHDMYATLVLIGAFGYLINTGIRALENHFLHWADK